MVNSVLLYKRFQRAQKQNSHPNQTNPFRHTLSLNAKKHARVRSTPNNPAIFKPPGLRWLGFRCGQRIFVERVFRQNDLSLPRPSKDTSILGFVCRRRPGFISKKGALCSRILRPYLECRQRWILRWKLLLVWCRISDIAINRTSTGLNLAIFGYQLNRSRSQDHVTLERCLISFHLHCTCKQRL